MDSAPTEPFIKGKREAEDAVEMGVAKRQRVEEIMSEMETDAIGDKEEAKADISCSEPDQRLKAKLSAEDGLLVSVLEDESNVVDGNKPAVTSEGHVAAASKNDESNCDTDSCCQDETVLDEDVSVTIRAPAPLREEETASSHRPKYESSMRYGSCPKHEIFSDDDVSGAITTCSDWCPRDETFSDDDVTGAILSLPAPSIPISWVSVQKKDGSHTVEIDSAPKTDDNVARAKKVPVVIWEKKDELGCDNKIFDEVAAESIPSILTKKEDETNDELELDDATSSSDDDDTQTPATPTEQTTGGKTLFVGNLSFSVEQEDVENFFKAAGEVVNIRFGMNSDETFKGYGYVEFASVEAAEKAFRELNGKELLRRRVRLDFAKERGTFTPYSGCQDTETFQKEVKAQGNTVFVRGFNKSDSQDEIRRYLEEHFGSCGEISRVSVPKDQDGCARGIAYIDFKDRDSFNRALALNGSEFRDGALSVKEATSRGDSRDIAGSGRGYGRNDVRYGWRDFSGRSFHEAGGGRSTWGDFSGWSAREAGGGRGDWRDFSGRRGGGGRAEWRDFSGRRGGGEAGGGRGDWREFSGRRGGGGGGRGDWQDFSGRQGGGGGGRGDWRHFGGRGDWRGRGIHGTGNWFQSGAWQDYSRKSGYGNYCNGSPFIPGNGGWFGGGVRGRGHPSEPCVAAPEGDGKNTSGKDADKVEDHM